MKLRCPRYRSCTRATVAPSSRLWNAALAHSRAPAAEQELEADAEALSRRLAAQAAATTAAGSITGGGALFV